MPPKLQQPLIQQEVINITADEPARMIDAIREALKSIGDGDISASAYDTAWVALVKKMDGGDGPQFPSSLDWIVQNQLPDTSWGDGSFFLVHDRIISTLACVVMLSLGTFTLISMAKEQGLDIPFDELVLLAIYDRRDLKLAKIPMDVLHTIPTTLFLSIEGDRKCFEYLDRIVHKFKGGVPMNYPVDIFDRLDRLGTSRHFASEIKECLDYVYR
ncbi:hypothetical protein E2562_037206 [Oryza meyeriana var. granulata]|uniref:Terpene synthase N-terminal domain-containing protein n=1 Tax=Oryza meyeriana var. granulata TaxID=110450 RepID=A0A6G1CAB0_9ORYZ|nr:hypothetical protein E2562_037206 [Oryza meyeriana var. granulata]